MAEVVALSGYPELQHPLFEMLGLVVAAHAIVLQACDHQLHVRGLIALVLAFRGKRAAPTPCEVASAKRLSWRLSEG